MYSDITVHLRPRATAIRFYTIPAFLATIAVALVVLHYISSKYKGYSAIADTFAPLFNLHSEANIPTWYSTMLWATASYLAFSLSRMREMKAKGLNKQWLAASLLFLFMSMDEASAFHEKVGDMIIILNGGKLSGFFFYEWVIYGLLLTALAAAYFIPMIARLGPFVCFIFLFAAATFVSGALGLEMIQAAIRDGTITAPHWLRSILGYGEEFLEMIGVVVLIYGLLYVRSRTEPQCPPGSELT